ncbi:MAG: PEGA domain-containing protein [Terriglobales bacterium]
MATMFGRFEIQSELSKSDTALIYKATDLKTEQVVALKTQSLERLGERKDAFVSALLEEGERARDLASQNLVALYGAGEIEGQFCAAMEYIQGNSIATMLARNEGFSIWDLIDITRQICAGLEYAASSAVAHYSLEPAKLMVQWDGTVKIVGYGISNMSLIEAESGRGLGRLMCYCSPEQLRGEAIDLRSNMFSLGAILYEMAVGRKAFDAADPVDLVSQIENEMPPVPVAANNKVHPAMSTLIMKALAKDPAMRYQTGHELVEDLEKCRESGKKGAAGQTPKPAAAPNTAASRAAREAAASKFVSAASDEAASARTDPSVSMKQAVPVKQASSEPVGRVSSPTGGGGSGHEAAKLNFAAAAGAGASAGMGPKTDATGRTSVSPDGSFDAKNEWKVDPKDEPRAEANPGGRLISDFEVEAPEAPAASEPVLSAVVAPEVERPSPRVAVDPMMSEPVSSSSSVSFSDMAEMPPLKGPVYVPPAPAVEMPVMEQARSEKKEEKPRIQPQEVAKKAMQQVATIPPRLILYSLLGAVGLILMVALAVFFHVHSEDDGMTSAPKPVKASSSTSSAASSTPAPTPTPDRSMAQPATLPVSKPVAPVVETQPRVTVRPAEKRSKTGARGAMAAATPVVIPGEALIDSTPQGAGFQVDGQSDPSWVTPFTVTGLSAGKHIISVSKAGYSSDVRSVDVASGSRASLVLHLSPMNALVVVNSTPAGAEIMLDGKPTGRVSPAQFAVEKGSHTVLLRKRGYLDETVTADLGAAQNFQYAPVLKALGNTEDMKTLGSFNRLFGRSGENAAGMGSIVVHTRPKGAQVVINQQILDKTTPLGVAVGPGNYVVDITLTGFKPIHKVVNVDKGNRATIDEVLERE